MAVALRVEDLGKAYRISSARRTVAYRTLRDDLVDLARSVVSFRAGRSEGSETVWALRDVSFEVREGEVVGLIGHNGAGKSTLLKILSRVTEPTKGYADILGRVGSLLEVGTGFHPELSGRENIYLNGAILGMTRAEIRRRFDEIVDFAEVERFLDTPVKRYSSGMHVRLAFAVAAHLEPEILLVDEVLAVGDAGFQKKCLNKMGDYAGEGRTILLVSHDLGAIRSLCPRAILLEGGRITHDGPVGTVLDSYVSALGLADPLAPGEVVFDEADGSAESIRLRSIRLLGPGGQPSAAFLADSPIPVEITYTVSEEIAHPRFNLHLLTAENETVFVATDHMFRDEIERPGTYRTTCMIPGGLLNRRKYAVGISCDVPRVRVLVPMKVHLSFTVIGDGNQATQFSEDWPGAVCPRVLWTVEPLS
jgi:lipopolysaccharide transport system ATP-binding protein